jgi:RNA polymerase sigma-70 factor (ECF subfamily)
METLRHKEQQLGRLSDTAIIRRILSGEKALFELLIRRYNQTLYRAVRSYIKEGTIIDDVMQDTYLKAYQKLDQFRHEAAFATWLIRIGINEALLHIRKQQKVKLVFLQPTDSITMNPEKQTIRHEVAQFLQKAIDELPESYRVIYILKEVEGMNIHDIAHCLSLGESNVKVRLHRAKNLLKDKLYGISSDASLYEFGSTQCDRLTEKVMQLIS